jgi:hypothetical protein
MGFRKLASHVKKVASCQFLYWKNDLISNPRAPRFLIQDEHLCRYIFYRTQFLVIISFELGKSKSPEVGHQNVMPPAFGRIRTGS